MQHLLVNFRLSQVVYTIFHYTFRLCLDKCHKARVHLDRIERESDRTDELVNETNHLLATTTSIIRLNAHIVVDVQQLLWVLRLDEHHAMTLLDVLNDLSEVNQFI